MLNLLDIFYYRQPAIPMGSTPTDTTNLRSKIFEKKILHLNSTYRLFLLVIIPYTIKYNDYLCSIYIVLDTKSNLE